MFIEPKAGVIYFCASVPLAIFANFAYGAIKGMPPFTSSAVWQAMLWWFTLLLSVMGGRVIPFLLRVDLTSKKRNHYRG